MQDMKMAREITCCCVALLLALTSVSAAKNYQKLDSIRDLQRCGQSAPTNRLELLHWFATTVDINNNNVIRLNFNPFTDYGSHHYGNFDNLLPQGNYWTVGNILQTASRSLPPYVVNPHRQTDGWNMARIIIGSRDGGRTVDRIYITEHYETSSHETRYNPEHTNEVTTNLLQELRRLSINEIQRLSYNSQFSYTPQSAQSTTNQSHFLRDLLLVIVLVVGLIVLLPILGNVEKY